MPDRPVPDAIPVDWNADGASGDLDGVTVSSSGSAGDITPADLTGSDFSYAPRSDSTEFDVDSDWTATFSEPVSGLLLYIAWWRGVTGHPVPNDGHP